MNTLDHYTRLRHAPGVTGFRAVAVLLVMVYHLGTPFHGGFIGVNMFFVLSGFLITHLLLDEMVLRGRIAFGNFYARRALRLYPALIALVVAVATYSLLVPGAARADQSLGSIPAVMLYFSNWVRAIATEPLALGMFEHTWSLSIEEQFYLVWPVAVWATIALSRKVVAVGMVACVGIVSSIVVRVLLPVDAVGGSRAYNGTDTQADQLLYGALLAVVVISANRNGRILNLERVFRFAFWPATAVLVVATVAWPYHGTSVPLRLALAPVGVAAACLVGYAYLAPRTWQQRALGSRLGSFIGERSYALYLWHYPIFAVLLPLGTGGLAGRLPIMLLALAASFVAAELSYRFVETPFRQLKDRLARKERTNAAIA